MDISERTQRLALAMAKQMRVRDAGSLEDVATRAGRKLPKRYRSDVQTLIEAERMSDHPKLSLRLDHKAIARSERRLNAYLGKQNPAAERRGEILDLVAGISFVFVTIILAVFFYLLSTGYFE